MPKLVLAGFDGLYPRTSPTLLRQNQATVAQDVKIHSGELRAWGSPANVFTTSNGGPVYSIYKIYNDIGQSSWLTWAGIVDAVLGPLADVSEVRVYYTDGTAPKKTNYVMAIGTTAPYPTNWLNMGVPTPATAPTVGVTTGSSVTAETRAYVYTYVSTFGSVTEESAPSPASALVTISTGNAVDISGFATAPTANYNITAIRIYRTISGSTTGASFAFVDEIPVTASTGVVVASGNSTNGVAYTGSTYKDDYLAASLGEALGTSGWGPPPAALQGIVALGNGMLAGFVGNAVYFSEPYFPHSWPLEYQQTVPFNIVGLGVFSGALVVCTDKYPVILSGADPSSMSQEVIALPEPCMSKRSIVSAELSVTYASPNGLVSIGSFDRGIVTSKLFRREEWQQFNPSSIIAQAYAGKYFGFFTSTLHGNGALVLGQDEIIETTFQIKQATTMTLFNQAADAVHVDVVNGILYYTNPTDNNVYQLDATSTSPLSYTWTSKRFMTDHANAWSVIKVDADYSTGGSVTVNISGDNGATAASVTVSSLDPVRLPAFRAREMGVSISGNVSVRSITLSTSFPELYQ